MYVYTFIYMSSVIRPNFKFKVQIMHTYIIHIHNLHPPQHKHRNIHTNTSSNARTSNPLRYYWKEILWGGYGQ